VKGGGDIEDPIAKSTGEAQLLSLSFVGSVAKEAFLDKKQSEERREDLVAIGSRGGFYPVVMDSPFGNLDVDYQAPIAQALPALAPQVVVLVSRSQAGGVEQRLAPHIGRCYVINFHTDKPGWKTSCLTAFGREVPIISANPDEPEWAEIVLITDMEK
jgi:DNA sulfur modification protein DndD